MLGKTASFDAGVFGDGSATEEGEDWAVATVGRAESGEGRGGALFWGTDVASEFVIEPVTVELSCDRASVERPTCLFAFAVAEELVSVDSCLLPAADDCEEPGISDRSCASNPLLGMYFEVFDFEVAEGLVFASKLLRRAVSTFSLSGVFLLMLVPLRTLLTSGSSVAVSGGLGGAGRLGGVATAGL